MMRLSTLLLALVLAFATMAPSAQGLAFVAGIMRAPVNPVAAIRSFRQRTPAPTTLTARTASVPSNDEQDVQPKIEVVATFGCDSIVQAYRDEMTSLVYQRSLERMNGFSSQ